MKHRQSVGIKQVGTKRDNLKITNVRDKSLIRKIKSSKKEGGIIETDLNVSPLSSLFNASIC